MIRIAADEFGFDDEEKDRKLGGDIALAFFLLGAPASFVIGCMADTTSRRNMLFGGTVLIGEGACALTYFTTTYEGLFVTRALTGFSVGGALPLLSSLLGDWYHPEERSTVMALVGIGTGLGIALGQGIAGVLGPRLGWRLPFLVLSVPALILGMLIMFTVKDPIRGSCEDTVQDSSNVISDIHYGRELASLNDNNEIMDGDEGNYFPVKSDVKVINNANERQNLSKYYDSNAAQSDQQHMVQLMKRIQKELRIKCKNGFDHPCILTAKTLLSTPTVILSLFQGAPGCVPWGIVNTFLNDFLSQDCGMTVQGATMTILVFGFGNFIGILIGGIGGGYLYKKDARYPSLLSGLMAIFGCFPLWLLINYNYGEGLDDQVRRISGWTTKSVLTELVFVNFVSFLAGLGSGVTGPIVKATLQNVTPPLARGQAFAMLNIFDDFGRGFGPVFVAMLIRNLGSRRTAFNVGISGWILCGLLNMMAFFTVRADEDKTRQIVLEKCDDIVCDNETIRNFELV